MKKRILAALLAFSMLLTTAYAMPIYVDGSDLGWQEPLTLEVESGNRICKKIRGMEQPSIFAASSSSDGKLRKFCRMKNVTLILIKLGMIMPISLS